VIELRIATGLLGCRYGLDDLLGTPLGTEVATRLRAGEWPIHLRLAFASQIRWRIRKAVLDRDVSLATALFSFAARAFGVTSALATKNNFGVDEWRRDHRPTIRA
jgi:hypothetical protein